MENNLPNPSFNNLPDERPRVSPPPPPPISIRTLDSDIKSMAQSGGSEPAPQVLNTDQTPKKETPLPPSAANSEIKIQIPGYSGPEEQVFNPETLPTDNIPSGKNKISSKSIIVIVLLIGIAIGLGGVGYFFVYPLIFPAEKPVTTSQPVATTTPETVATPITHQSLITSDKQEILLSISMASPERLASSTGRLLKEIVLNDADNHQQPFSKYFSLLVPELSEADLKAAFNEDFTAFVFYNADGAWPGYIAKIKDPSNLPAARALAAKLETSANLSSFFLSNPGSKSADGFKDGQIFGSPARYVTFAQKGSALSYAWLNGQYLLIATNYQAGQEAASRLIAK